MDCTPHAVFKSMLRATESVQNYSENHCVSVLDYIIAHTQLISPVKVGADALGDLHPPADAERSPDHPPEASTPHSSDASHPTSSPDNVEKKRRV